MTDLKIIKSEKLEALIDQCKKGNSRAQRELYEKYSRKMLGVCRRYLKEEEAEDAMIKGFMKVFNKIGQYEGLGNFEGWMRRIMVNESLMEIRKNKMMYIDADIAEIQLGANYQIVNKQLESEDLLKLIDRLPYGYRTVFNLYAIEGFSHKEIAESLEITESTSKSQLSRARTMLQHLLAEIDNNLKSIYSNG